jgi:hypothetical protein
MNIDGISLCDKSKQSMWPVIFVIIELPKEIRYCLQIVIIAGKSKTFYKTFKQQKPFFKVFQLEQNQFFVIF